MGPSTSSSPPPLAGQPSDSKILITRERSPPTRGKTFSHELRSQSGRPIFKVSRPLSWTERFKFRFRKMDALQMSPVLEAKPETYEQFSRFKDFFREHRTDMYVDHAIFLELVMPCDSGKEDSNAQDPWICIAGLSDDEILRVHSILSTRSARAAYSPLRICYGEVWKREVADSSPSTIKRTDTNDTPSEARKAAKSPKTQPTQAPLQKQQYFHVPYPRNAAYRGNEALFEQLGALLAPRQGFDFQRRFVIQGIGGSGKTQFALEFAYRNRNKYWGVFWINGNTETQARASIHDIAQLLNLEGDPKSILTQLYNLQDGKDFLLVFDDAGDILFSMDTYFPPGPKGTILITTRDHEDRGLGNVGPGYFEFNRLETGNAVRLFLEESGQPEPWDVSTMEEARHIVESCGGLPLAIVQLARSRMDRREILQKLQAYDTAERAEDSSSPLRMANFSVNGLFEDVFLRLSPSALRLLRVMSFLLPREIPAKMLQFAQTNSDAGAEGPKVPPKEDSVEFSWFIVLQSASHITGSSELERFLNFISLTTDSWSTDVASNPISLALTELQSKALIRYDAKDDTYWMHPVVQQQGRTFRYPLDADEGYFEKMAAMFVGRATTRSFWDRIDLRGALEFEKKLLRHMDHLMSNHQDNWPIEGGNGDISCMFALGYFMSGDWRTAATLLKEFASYCQRHLGERTQTTRHAIHLLTVAHFKLAGYIENANVFPVSAIDGWRVELKPYFHHVLREVQALGRQRWREKRYNEARDIQERVLEELMSIGIKGSNIDLVVARDHLGSTLQAFMNRKDLQRARDLHWEAIEGGTWGTGENVGPLMSAISDADLNVCWSSVLWEGSDTTVATNVLLESMPKCIGIFHQRYRCVVAFSLFLSALGYAAEAENLIREAIRMISNTGANPQPVDLDLCRALLCCILFRAGRVEEARKALRAINLETFRHFFAENDIPPVLLLVPVALAFWALTFDEDAQGPLLLSVLSTELGRIFGAHPGHPLIEDLSKTSALAADSERARRERFAEVIRDLHLTFLALLLGHSSKPQTMDLDTKKLHQIMEVICPEKPPDDAGSTISSSDSDSCDPTNPRYAESIFSAVMSEISMSSNSSLDYVVAARGQVVQLLLGEDEIQDLVTSALKDPKIGARRFARNFRRLLVELSKDLLTQATSLAHKDAAKLIRTQSLQIANMVNSNSLAELGSIQQEEGGMWAQLDNAAQPEGQQQILAAYLQSLPDRAKNREAWDTTVQPHEGDVDSDYDDSSDNSDDEEMDLDDNPTRDDGKLSTHDLEQVKDFIRTGPPLAKFKERLRKFVSPTFAHEDVGVERLEDANLIENPVGEEAVTDGGEKPVAPQGTLNHAVNEPIAPARMMPTAVSDEVAFQVDMSSTTRDKDIAFVDDNSKGVASLSPDPRGKDDVAPDPEENIPSDTLPAKHSPSTYPANLPELLDSIVEKITGPETEPPVPSGHSRIRWTCECGTQLFDDYIELEEGALKDLQATLQKRPNQADDPDHGKEGPWHLFSTSSFQSGIDWLNQRASRFLTQSSDSSLPVYQANNPPIHLATLDLLRLLFCIQAGETGLKLHQEKLTGISSDREVLLFLRSEYYRRRNVSSWLTFRNVSTVSLARFMVDASSFAEVHKHAHFCHTADCVCLPPVEKIGTEYACRPAPQTKPKYFPAIGPRYLTHHFRRPDCLRPTQKFIYNQLPKRACGQFSASDDQMEFGWGVYFEEGWHWMSIYLIIVLLLVSGSLVFGVTWSITKGDVQGGFAISSLWMTIGSLLLGYIAVRSIS